MPTPIGRPPPRNVLSAAACAAIRARSAEFRSGAAALIDVARAAGDRALDAAREQARRRTAYAEKPARHDAVRARMRASRDG